MAVCTLDASTHKGMNMNDQATGPYLLEVLLSNPNDPSQRRWVLVQSVATLQQGLSVASRACQSYQYRLYMGPCHGYMVLDWQDDPTDADMCVPVWVWSK